MSIKTDAEYIIFMSSSGHCLLNCSYCIINPIVKNQPSLTFEDVDYLLNQIQKKAALIFSGKGDFFAGYKRTEKFLARLLEKNVEIALDINGVLIHEFPELTDSQLQKIRLINLTMHYRQLVDKKLLDTWKENALILLDKKGDDDFMLGFVLSPPESYLWQDALQFFEKNIFAETNKKITLIKDISHQFNAEDETKSLTIKNEFSHLIKAINEEDFSARFKNHSHVICPAGNTYFRVWNDGCVQGCPNILTLKNCGNLKDRTFTPKLTMFTCHDPRYCDCNILASLDRIVFEDLANYP